MIELASVEWATQKIMFSNCNSRREVDIHTTHSARSMPSTIPILLAGIVFPSVSLIAINLEREHFFGITSCDRQATVQMGMFKSALK